jgi:dienelactone hydrolase
MTPGAEAMADRFRTTTRNRPARRRRRWATRLRTALAVPAILIVAVYLLGESYKKKDFMPHFHERKSELVTVDERIVERTPEFVMSELSLADAGGIELGAYLKVPSEGGPLHPVMITLGGAAAGREVIDYLGDTGGWTILALDYPYRGSRDHMSHWEFVSVLPGARRAMLDTVPAGMLAVDYLHGRDDVDRSRIVLAGGSFGALFSPALAAADERISAVAILFGAGHLQKVIDANLDMPSPARQVVAWVGSVIVSPMEPLKYIHRISPRPVFMLSGTEDLAMPEAISRALHDAAGEPKTVRWLSLGHVNLKSTEFHQQVLDECMDWLQEIGFMTEEEIFVLPDSRDPRRGSLRSTAPNG